jgi:chemotaxis receptor (MCP) glutamine deamidase CheD
MNTLIEGLHEVFLNPGEFHFGEGTTRISTLLGSCVSITLWQSLASRHIALIAQHVGGSGRRKLHLDLWSGDAWLAFPQTFDAHIRSTYG